MLRKFKKLGMSRMVLKYLSWNNPNKVEIENHAIVAAGHAAYTDRFHELPRLVPHLVTPKGKTIERNGSIKKNHEKRVNGGEPSKDRNVRNDKKRTRIGNALAKITNREGRESTGHFAKDCRVVPRNVNPINARNPAQRPGVNHQNQVVVIGGQSHGNQENQARGRAFMLEAEKVHQDLNIVTRNLKLLINFVWKFMGIVRFGNDHVAAILGFGQFFYSDLEVAFRRNACFVRNLEGADFLKGDGSTNLYTINLHEMASASPICLMARLPKFKYHKEHLCPSCEQGKSKRVSHPPKPVPNSRQRLHLLHMDLCGPIRMASINGKRITVLLQSPVIVIRTDNDTEFKNQVLKEYFDTVGISH
nr:reverse transcriptase domain-containing protein [Tanacetum cinerariifolium]